MLLVCVGCATKYALGLKSCPHCGSDESCEDREWGEESGMPKIGKHAGPTVAKDPRDSGVGIAEPPSEVEENAQSVDTGSDSGSSSDSGDTGSYGLDTQSGEQAEEVAPVVHTEYEHRGTTTRRRRT